MDLEIKPDNRVRPCPHLAGAHRMMVGLCVGAAVVEKLFVGHHLRSGKPFGHDIGLQRRLLHDLARDLQPFQGHRPVVGIGPVVRVDQWRGGRVGG